MLTVTAMPPRSVLRALAAIVVTATLLALLPALAPTPAAAQAAPPPAGTELSLTVLHYNDGESALLPSGPAGGVARFETLIENNRVPDSTSGGVKLGDALLNSGDNFLAGAQFQASLDLPDGEPFFDSIAQDAFGVDALAIGNHEFDFGPGVLAEFIRGFDLSSPNRPEFLAANLDFSMEDATDDLERSGVIAGRTTFTVNGEDIGVVGAAPPDLGAISSPEDVVVEPETAEEVQEEIDALTAAGVNKIFLVSQLQSINNDRALLAMLDGVDVAIAGGGEELQANASTPLLPGERRNDQFPSYPFDTTDENGTTVPIVTTNGDYKYLGEVVVNFDAAGNVLEDVTGDPIRNCAPDLPACPEAVAEDETLRMQVIDPLVAFTAELRATTVAQSEVALEGRRGTFGPNAQPGVRVSETNLGNLFADALLARGLEESSTVQPNRAIGVQNSGGIRNSSLLPRGSISRLNTFEIAPFSNFLSVVPDLTPESLTAVLEQSVSNVANIDGRFLQIAGLDFTYDISRPPRRTVSPSSPVASDPGSRVRDVTLDDGTPIVRDGVVVEGAPSVDVFTNNFSAAGGDNLPFFRSASDGGFQNFPVSYQQALEDFLRGLETVTFADFPEGGESRITAVQPDPAGELYALSDIPGPDEQLVRYDADDPSTPNGPPLLVTGVPGNLVAIDVRPATTQLFGLSDDGTIYRFTISGTTANGTAIGPPIGEVGGGTVGFDFNPVVDRIRIVTGPASGGRNLRVNPDGGAVTVDAAPAYATSDSGSGSPPRLAAAGYTYAPPGGSTSLYVIDSARETIDLQDPANDGTLRTRGELKTGTTPVPVGGITGLDLTQAQTSTALLSFSPNASAVNLATVDVLTGEVEDRGPFVGSGGPVLDIAAIDTVDDTPPVAPTITAPPVINSNNVGRPYPVSGTAESGTVVTVTLQGESGTAPASASATARANGTYTVTFTSAQITALPQGPITVTAVAVDGAGNRSPNGTATTRKDTVPPPAPTIDRAADGEPPDITPANQSSYTVSGTAETGTVVGVRITDQFGRSVGTSQGVRVGDDGRYTVTLDVSSLSPGRVTIGATATDAAFNTGPEGTAQTNRTVADTSSPPPSPGPSDTPSTTPSDSPSTTPTDTPTMRPSPRPSATPDPGDEEVTRVQGQGRTETALQVSQGAFGPGEADAVVLTRPDIFPDALAGTPLAIQENAPLLLTAREGLEAAVAAEITRVLPAGGTVYLLGGTEALTPQIQTDVEALGFTTVRYGGANRFATAQVIANDGLDEPTSVLLADGSNFPDAVAAGAAAGATNGAVLLTGGDTVPNETQAYLDAAGDDAVFAIGGPATRAVPTATPVFGATRIDTAVAVAAQFFPAPTVAGIATSEDFPDALSGGAVVGALGGPLLLSGQTLEPAVENYLEANADSIDQAFLFGGTARLPQSVEDAVTAAIAD